MPGPVPDDSVAEYVTVLRGFGLDDAEIVALHDDPGGVEDPDPVAHLRVLLDETDPESLWDRLHSVLAESDRGISAPFDYWHSVPPVQIGQLLEPYGYRIDVEHRGEGSEDPFRITVEDRVTGRTRVRTFTYPDGPLGGNNYPALVYTVEDMLDRDGPTFALLTAREARWRFVLAPRDDLTDLRSKYGDRVEVFGDPVLSAYQPRDFADGAPEGAAERRTEAAPAPLTSDPGGGQRSTDEEAKPSVADVPENAPDWLRSAAAKEGGVDAIVDALRDSGPRTHVSGRTADDILGEVPGRVDPDETRTTTGSGIDEVFETLEASAGVDPDPGPSKVVSESSVDDVFEMIGEPTPGADDADSILDAVDGLDAEGDATARSGTAGTGDVATPGPDADEADEDGGEDDDPLDSLVGADPEPTVVSEDGEVAAAGSTTDAATHAGSSEPGDPASATSTGTGTTPPDEPEDGRERKPSGERPARAPDPGRRRGGREDVVEINVGGDFESLLEAAESVDPEDTFEDLSESEDADPDEFLPDAEGIDPDALVERAEADETDHEPEDGGLEGFLGGDPETTETETEPPIDQGPETDAPEEGPEAEAPEESLEAEAPEESLEADGPIGDRPEAETTDGAMEAAPSSEPPAERSTDEDHDEPSTEDVAGDADHTEPMDPAIAEVIEHVGEEDDSTAASVEPADEATLAGSGIRDAESTSDRPSSSLPSAVSGDRSPPGATVDSTPGSGTDDATETTSVGGDGSTEDDESAPSIVAGVGSGVGGEDSASARSDATEREGGESPPTPGDGDQPDMQDVLASIEDESEEDDRDDGDARPGGLLAKIRSLFGRLTGGD